MRIMWFFLILMSPAFLHAHENICNQVSLPDNLKTTTFRHPFNASLSLSTPYHTAQDVLVAKGHDVVIEGKFSYGTFRTYLEDEFVEIWLDNCSGSLLHLGRAITNYNGRMKVVLYASQIPSTGIFQVYLRVMGDNTFVKLMLRVLTRETNLVVFDIDGTLTIGDDELLNHVLNRSYVPREREGAQTLTQIWYNANNEIIYLSGRHYFLTDHSRQWLAQKGFAPGTLIHAQSLSRIWPSKGGVGDYKRSYLQYLQDNGFLIKAAYGNAKTDIYAYEKVNIPKLATFMLGNAGEENEQDMNWIGENFLSHIQKLISGESDVLS